MAIDSLAGQQLLATMFWSLVWIAAILGVVVVVAAYLIGRR